MTRSFFMRKFEPILLILFFCCLNISIAEAQEEDFELNKIITEEDNLSSRDLSKIKSELVEGDSLRGWKNSWSGRVNGSQASFSNWSQGGVNTISMTASTIFNAMFQSGRFSYTHSTDLKFGKAKIEDEGTRKTDDLIALRNKFNYEFSNPAWSVFGSVSLRTQFDEGFEYAASDDEEDILISKFFAPAYLTEIIGVQYKPVEYFNTQLGVTGKETFVRDTRLSTRYGLAPGESFGFEPGFSFLMNFDKTILTNVRYISSFETFTNVENDFSGTDIYFANELVGSINSFLNTSFQFEMVLDKDFSDEIQVKQVLSVGISVNFL